VYPHEVELVLSAHPAVAESAVVGVPHPRTGKTVRAYVVPVPQATVAGTELIPTARVIWPDSSAQTLLGTTEETDA
jgi:acyl-coenzyme A synthetase/AMP-(fatty) acid ligase